MGEHTGTVETVRFIFEIIVFVATILTAVFVGHNNALSKRRDEEVKTVVTRMDKSDERMDEIEENYLTRFEQVNANVVNANTNILLTKEEILKEVNGIKILVVSGKK